MSVSGTSVKSSRCVLRVFAAIGALLSGVFAGGAWALIGFDRHYFPALSIVPRYIELTVWSVLAVYLAVVAYFGSLKPWSRGRDHVMDR